MCKVCSSLGQKWGNERAITGSKIILTSPLYSNIACNALGAGNQQDLSNDLECDPFLDIALQRFTCDLYYHFGAFLSCISAGIITGKHYTKKL